MSNPLLSMRWLEVSSDLGDDMRETYKEREETNALGQTTLVYTNEIGLGDATAPAGPFPHGPVCGGEKRQGAGAVRHALRTISSLPQERSRASRTSKKKATQKDCAKEFTKLPREHMRQAAGKNPLSDCQPIMNLRELLVSPFNTTQRTILPLPYGDTLYEVKTTSRTFCDRMVYDDEVILHLTTTTSKPVKILKVNVSNISVYEGD
ncbi:MAG: hypothetical protein ACKO96_37720 [Flammeovirgaceae bacterium]